MSGKTKESSTFDECVSNKISLIADEEPDVKPDQRTAIAYSVCRKKFGISKANILFLLEKSKLFDNESLEDVKATMEKGMESVDWREFAAILKKEGMKHQEICERVNKSETWIKKYVNPILKEVTPSIKFVPASDTTERLKPGLPIHTVLTFTVSEIKKETRTFGGWGSVEVVDSQKDIVSIEGLEAIMPTYMKRGAPIMFGHSNRHVGNVFKYKIKDKLVKGKYIPALWLEGRIHSDYKIDDMAWDALQYAYTAGLPVLSLGATPIGHPEVQCNDVSCFKKYDKFQLYEFTISNQQKGSIGANPEATIEVAMVKVKEDKQLISEKSEELEKSTDILNSDIDFVNMMLASCEICQEEYQKLIKQGQTEEKAKSILLKGMVEILNRTEESEKDKTKINTSDNPDEIKKAAMLKDFSDLAAVLTKIDNRLDSLDERFEKLEKTTSEPGNTNAGFVPGSGIVKQEEEEEEEEDKEPEVVPPPVAKAANESADPQITFSKDFEKQMEEYLAKKGFQKVAETPIPATTTGRAVADIHKGTANLQKQSKWPSEEEMLDAVANYSRGGPTALARKYGY